MFKSLIHRCLDLFDVIYQHGDTIDKRYRLECLLGVGGYGKSYLVFDLSENKYVVLKMLRLHKRMRERGRKSFRNEVELLGNFDHHSLPKLYHYGEDGGIPYFSMEYINGKTFEQLIFQEGKTFNEMETFKMAEKLIQIIGYLHSKQVVHRDIRIPNVMVQDDELKLIDFGLARKLKSNEGRRIRRQPNRMKDIAVQSDFYGVGHFILFLLYSEYQAEENAKEKSWEEELELSAFSKTVIRKLLQLEEPYENWQAIQFDFFKVIHSQKEEK